MTWSHSQYCDALEAEVERMATTCDGADMAAPVPLLHDIVDHSKPLTLANLIAHLGTIHRWATKIVDERLSEPASPRSVNLGLPGHTAGYADWLREGGRRMLNTFRAADPEASVWAWGPDRHVRWWPRRQLHETSIHRADAERALGRQPSFETVIAVDGVDEFLANLSSVTWTPGVKELKGSGSLHFHSTDADGEWLLELAPDGFTWQHGHAKGDVAVRATAGDLYLLLWGREKPPSPERFQIFGDEALLQRWLAGSAI
jgi:uncharacterized protein (TIGR03083 family)